MDIVKHIIKEERIRKQMYDNHECTALELEGRSFNENILKLADRIEELEAQLEAVRPYLRHNTVEVHCDYMKHSDSPCTCGLEAAIGEVES